MKKLKKEREFFENNADENEKWIILFQGFQNMKQNPLSTKSILLFKLADKKKSF